MNDHDENPDNGTPDHVVNPSPEAPAQVAPPVIQPVAESQPPRVLAGDPMAAAIPAFQAKRILPEDLRVSWSWPHLIIFIFFGFASLMVVQLGFVFYVSANRHLSAVQVQRVFENSPQLLVETNVLWYALLFPLSVRDPGGVTRRALLALAGLEKIERQSHHRYRQRLDVFLLRLRLGHFCGPGQL